jgi:phosphatidylinositol phosphate synthase
VHPALLAFLLTVAAALTSMAVYAARGARADGDVAGKGAHFFGGAGDFLLHWFMWAIQPTVSLSLRLGLGPDFYNYAGLALGAASGALIAAGELEWAGWAIVLGGLADVLDGRIARLTGVASDYGDFIDSTFDRFVEAFIFLGFALWLRADGRGAPLAAAALAGSFLVSYARARGEVRGVECSGGLMQRGERLLIVLLACFLDRVAGTRFGWARGAVAEATLAALALTSFVTAAQRTVWIARRLRAPR